MRGRPIINAAALLSVVVASTMAWSLSLTPEHGLRGITTFCVQYVVLDDTPVSESDSGVEDASVRELRRLGASPQRRA